MTNICERDFSIQGHEKGAACHIEEVYHSAVEQLLVFVTSGKTKPSLVGLLVEALKLDPLVTRIQIMTSSTFDLCTIYTFRLNDDGTWTEWLPDGT